MGKEEVAMVRVPIHLIEKIRELFPELQDESDSTVVRVALNKYLREATGLQPPTKPVKPEDYEWIEDEEAETG